MSNFAVDGKEIAVRIIKYIIEGLLVGVAAYLLPKNKLSLEEILTLGLIAAALFSILDLLSPSVGQVSRYGVAFGVGSSLVGWPSGGLALAK